MKKTFSITILCLFFALLISCSISINKLILDFGSTEISKTFELSVIGPVGWFIEATADWVRANPNNGNTTQTVFVTVDRTEMEPGNYEAFLVIENNRNLPAQEIKVTMVVDADEPPHLAVQGFVYQHETDNPLADVLVTVDANSFTTGDNGFYFIEVQPPGEKIIHASKEGYIEYTHAVAIEDGIIEHTIFMFPTESESTSTSSSSIPPASTTTTTAITQSNQACCLNDGSCDDVEPDYCNSILQGIPEGPGTTCATVSCSQPIACCLPDGSCADLLAENCSGMGGSYFPDFTCLTLPLSCQPEACCLEDGSCKDEIPYFCDNDLGIPQGTGTTCATVSCPQP